MTAIKIPVSVCRYGGRTDRFFGKFKDTGGKWKKIPGGPFPEQFDTPTKARVFAERWYLAEMAERALQREVPESTSSWPDICEKFDASVRTRLRGADGSKNKLIATCALLKRSAILQARPIHEHDESLALVWLHHIAKEPKSADKPDPRHPYTIRNAAGVLGNIYKWARSQNAFPRDRLIPTDGDEFRAEIKFLLSTVKKREVMCPTTSVKALVTNAKVDVLRRLTTHVYAFTGLRPGELHGLRVRDVKVDNDILYFDVHEQWTLPRTKVFPSKTAQLKTRWSERQIPIHPALRPVLEQWLSTGWRNYVGREPTSDDPVFPDLNGKPFREPRSTEFVEDLKLAGCPTEFNGITLTTYSLRHTFATLMLEFGVDSDARNRLMGHRPQDTKALAYQVTQLRFLFGEISKLPPLVAKHTGDSDGGNSK